MSVKESQSTKVSATSYNILGDHFIVCTDIGFRVHEVKSCKLKVNCTQIEGGLSLCQSYNNTNIFFFVGTGRNPALPSTKLCLWDDSRKEIAAEVEFAKPILDLKVLGEWIVIVDA